MQPQITVSLFDDGRKAFITVNSPQRIMDHPSGKFTLVIYKFVVEMEGGEIILDTKEACFDHASLQSTVTLPPQASEMRGKLMVAAVYGDGGCVFSESYVVTMPLYGKR